MSTVFGPGVHAPTLLLAISMFGFMMTGIAMGDSSALPTQRRALRRWALAMLAVGVSCLLFYLRGFMPWFLTFGVANLLLLGLPLFTLLAHAQLLQQPVPQQWLGLVAGAVAAGLLANVALGAAPAVGVVAISTGFTVLQAAVCWMLWRDFVARRKTISLAGALLGSPVAIAFAYRALRVLNGQTPVLAPQDASSLQVGVLMLGLVHVVGSSTVFFSMLHSSQRRALVEAFRRDGLTGVYSRQAFFELAIERLQQFPQQRHAVLMLDLDRFKQINDTYGHAGGDAALVHAARTMGLGLRSTDLLGRYGGEEFCLLLSDCSPHESLQLARRLVHTARLQSVRLPGGRAVCYTVSVGVAMTDPRTGADPETTLRAAIDQADRALYGAKRDGRDRALYAPPDAAGPAPCDCDDCVEVLTA